jgi:plasmid stabilization system protein ParE
MRKIIILPFAELDIRDSVNYYANKEEDLEKKYLKVINHAFLLISENPLSFPIVKHKIRKLAIKDFPFNIYYVFEKETIYILAVFHTKRSPKVWKTRKLK